MQFKFTKTPVKNRGVAPDSFLSEIIEWARTAPMELFAPNTEPADIYVAVKPILGPWESNEHRRAVMLEVMRVHAGFESSWNWNEGVDKTNQTSMAHREGEETGIFQVSYDSTWIANSRMKPFAREHEIDTPATFIEKMKCEHKLALEYYARLVRFNVKWAGPILRHEIDGWLSRRSVAEFQELIANA
jgi:hypothetical protein